MLLLGKMAMMVEAAIYRSVMDPLTLGASSGYK